MIKKIIKNPSAILAAGYVFGQGCVFLLLICAQFLGYKEMSGVLVVVVSMLSFCFQFGDFGNQNYLSKEIAKGNVGKTISFLHCRSVFAFLICSIVALWACMENRIDGLWIVAVCMPFVAALCGLSYGAFAEASGNYLKLVVINILPWVGMTCGLASIFLHTDTRLVMLLVASFAVFGCVIAFFMAKRNLPVQKVAIDSSTLLLVMPYILSPLGGQIWFRYVIFQLGAAVGLSSLGAMGVIRNLQIAILLCVGFLVRPALRLSVRAAVASGGAITMTHVFLGYRTGIIISSFLSFAAIGCWLYIGTTDSDTMWYWILLLAPIPLTLIGQAAASANQLRNGHKYILLTDYSCLCINVIAFISLVNYHPLLAIIVSESLHALALVAAYFLTSHKLENSTSK